MELNEGTKVRITRGRSKGHEGEIIAVTGTQYVIRFTDVPEGTPDMQGFSYDVLKAPSVKVI
jgi:hypothetical protein